jgi:hypothetical protein
MDTELLVENRIDDGRKLVSQLVNDGFEVVAAFWVRTRDERLWFLYIASPAVVPEKIGDAYRAAYAALSKVPGSGISLSQIKLVRPENPVARDAIAARDRSPSRIPARYHGEALGGLAIEEAYIYPEVLGPMTPVEVLQTVAALMNRSGFVQPPVVTFRDGSTIRAIPISIQARQPGNVEIGFLEVGTNASRIVRADEVVNIQ